MENVSKFPGIDNQSDIQNYLPLQEVAEKLGLPQHVLRFWATRFPSVRMIRRDGGNNSFIANDFPLLTTLRRLLYEQGLSIRDVQKQLDDHPLDPDPPEPLRRNSPNPNEHTPQDQAGSEPAYLPSFEMRNESYSMKLRAKLFQRSDKIEPDGSSLTRGSPSRINPSLQPTFNTQPEHHRSQRPGRFLRQSKAERNQCDDETPPQRRDLDPEFAYELTPTIPQPKQPSFAESRRRLRLGSNTETGSEKLQPGTCSPSQVSRMLETLSECHSLIERALESGRR